MAGLGGGEKCVECGKTVSAFVLCFLGVERNCEGKYFGCVMDSQTGRGWWIQVYFNERLRAMKKTYHKACFKCKKCDRVLTLDKYFEHEGEPYCQADYKKYFGPKVVGFGGSGIGTETSIQTLKRQQEEAKRKKEGEENVAKDAPEEEEEEEMPAGDEEEDAPEEEEDEDQKSARFGPDRFGMFMFRTGNVCELCGKNVTPTQKRKALGHTWHKDCFRCESCGLVLDEGEYKSKDGAPLCTACAGKLIRPKALGNAVRGKGKKKTFN